MHGIQKHFALSHIIPAAVHECEAAQKLELADGKVGVVGGLPALLPEYAHSNMSLPDHRDVVSAVSDGERGCAGFGVNLSVS